MSEDLIKHLNLPRSQIIEVLERLEENNKVIERKKDAPIMGYLESLQIVRYSGRFWHLLNPSRLAEVRSKLDYLEFTFPAKRKAILRKINLVHHKCAAAWRGNSKSGDDEPLLPDQIVTTDEVMRIRSCKTGLVICYRNGWQQFVDDETLQRTESSVSERLWLQKEKLMYESINLVITVENLGAFVDLPLVDGLLLLYVPGLNFTHLGLLQALPNQIPWVAFPDYDPNGLSIVHSIAQKLDRPCRIWLPHYWQDQVAQRGREMIGTKKKSWKTAPAFSLPSLREKERWLEQETLVLDYRCDKALFELVSKGFGIEALPSQKLQDIKQKD